MGGPDSGLSDYSQWRVDKAFCCTRKSQSLESCEINCRFAEHGVASVGRNSGVGIGTYAQAGSLLSLSRIDRHNRQT